MEKTITTKNKFQVYGKSFASKTQRALQKFANNLFMKSLVAGFVGTMPIILVSSFFVLIHAIPEALAPELKDNVDFTNFKVFATRIYQFTYGIMGLLVTGNIARAMMSELNNKLPFSRRVATYQVFIAGMIAYLVMSAIPVFSTGGGNFELGDPAGQPGFSGILWKDMGAGGILPGIVIGFTTPWIFFYCYKYNITIKLPKEVPGVISSTFLAIIPFGIAVLIWGSISYGFIAGLGQPFIPWFFDQLGGFIPQLKYNGEILTVDQFKELDQSIQLEIADSALTSFSNSYGIIVTYKIFETLFWFVGVHPTPVINTFETIMVVNQEMNVLFNELNIDKSFAFVKSLIDAVGTMGGTGATFFAPIICLMFARSNQAKIAGKSSVIPVMFQVNEPILFGMPMILNPIYLLPYVFIPVLNSVLAKLFVDNFGMQATSILLPWSLPYFITGPLAQLAQPQMFLLLFICTLIAFFGYLPFVLFHDKQLVQIEMEKCGKENFISMNGVQFQLNKMLSYDNNAHKQYVANKKELNSKSLKLNSKQIAIAQKDLLEKYNVTTIKNLFTIFKKIENEKINKLNEKYNSKVKLIDDKLEVNLAKRDAYNEKIDLKIEELKELEILLQHSYKDKIDQLENKKKKVPKKFKVEDDIYTNYKINLLKFKTKYLIRENIIKAKRTSDQKQRVQCNKNIERLQIESEKIKNNYMINKNKKIIDANKILAIYKNPYKLISDSNLIVKNVDNEVIDNKKENVKKLNILVLCMGAGSSMIFANAINQGASFISEYKIVADALSHSNYKQALNGVDLIVVSPQLGAYVSSIKADAKAYNIHVAATKGKQYTELLKNPKEAAKFAVEEYEKNQKQ